MIGEEDRGQGGCQEVLLRWVEVGQVGRDRCNGYLIQGEGGKAGGP